MNRSFRFGIFLLIGVALLGTALLLQGIYLVTLWWIVALGLAGALLVVGAIFGLRHELRSVIRGRRAEIALTTIGMIGIFVVIAFLSMRFPYRYDMTTAGLYSLSAQTKTMLSRLDKPVRITFFHDPKMRETVELYELMTKETPLLTARFHDPMLNPAQARLMGVRFAGTAIMESEDRRLEVNGQSETDIANGILRVSQSAKQQICFLDGHGEGDPFSAESHDHIEGKESADGHSHGMGTQYVLHERHGLAKARHALETLSYTVRKVMLTRSNNALSDCAVLVVAAPKTPLLRGEIDQIEKYLAEGGNALFLMEPFIETGLEPVIGGYGILLDETIVIDDASHFWADPSAPAVTSYNHHQVTRDLPLTFFPGVRSLSPTAQRVPGTAVVPVANSSANSFAETSRERAEFDETQDRAGPVTLMAVANRRPLGEDDLRTGDLGSAEVTAVASPLPENTSSARSRIAVIGDADFATNSFFHFLGNGDLFLNTISYLAARENLIGIEPRTYDLPRVSVTNRQIKATFVISVLMIPATLLLVGIGVWWRQR